MVALSEAWGSGALRWNADTRNRFANDLGYRGSLRAVSASSNLSKSDSDPATWLPPRAGARCGFIRDWVAAKWRLNLSVNTAKKTAISGVLQGCPRMTVTVSRDRIVLPTPPPPPSNCHSSYPTVRIPPPPPDLDCGDVRFDNFAVRAPDPHGFDGDNDGVGCES